MTGRRKLILALALVASMSLAACGGGSNAASGGAQDAGLDTKAIADCVNAGDASWKAVADKANQEGKVVMYSTMLPEINAALKKSFEKAYPKISLQITRIVGLEVNATLDAEKKTNKDGADVVAHINYDWMLQHLKDGYFVKPTGPASAGPQWKGTPYLIDDVFQVSLLTGIGIAYRTDMVKDAPQTYEDLLKPEYGNGQIGTATAEASSIADMYAWMQDKFGDDYLKKLAAQKPKIYATAVPTLDALLSGEISVDAFASSVGVAAAKAKGAPVQFILPKPAWAPLNLTYMLAKSKRPNASQVLFNFMACKAGQEALAKNNVSVLPGIPGTLGSSNSVTPANLERMTKPGWIASFYPAWQATFGR